MGNEAKSDIGTSNLPCELKQVKNGEKKETKGRNI